MERLISVVVCTHNRALYLKKTIDSLKNQTLDHDKFQVIVVDNNSVDSTKELVLSYCDDFNIKYVFEQKIGLSYTRNTGLQNVDTEYVAYLDDDAVADENWLENIICSFNTKKPKPSCIGGKVTAIWESEKPGWLDDQLICSLGIIDWGEDAYQIESLEQNWLIGANIAFDVSVIRSLGGFAEGLDREGKNLLSNGDILIQKNFIDAGYVCMYDPNVRVSHHVPANRLDKSWFHKRYYWQGKSDAKMDLLENNLTRLDCLESAKVKFIDFIKDRKNISSLIFSDSTPEKFRIKCFNLIKLGQISGYFSLGLLGRL